MGSSLGWDQQGAVTSELGRKDRRNSENAVNPPLEEYFPIMGDPKSADNQENALPRGWPNVA